MRLQSEDIYESILNEETFSRLPAMLAESHGARSCMLHWRFGETSAEVMAHSGYHSDEQMQKYAEDFTARDLWALEGTRNGRENRIWNCDQLVSPRRYENSEFYNEFIRSIGDDTYHCLGTFIKTPSGAGVLALQRGRTQGTFDEESARTLDHTIVHLRRMLAVKGHLLDSGIKLRRADAVADALGQALLVTTADGRIVERNAAGDDLLRRSDGLISRSGRLSAKWPQADQELKAALAKACAPSGSTATAVAVPRVNGGRYVLTVAPISRWGGPRQVLVVVRDPDLVDASLETRLQALYRLSPTEAAVAVRLAQGSSLSELANERQVTLATIRTQLKSVYHKLDCQRQTQVVALVNSLPLLHRRTDPLY